jgi:DNA topoisomerase-3
MEKNGIGTDASMATHINNIIERGYVKVETKNRKLIPLELGKALVLGIKSID